MHFHLVDRITALTPGSSITTIKNLTMAEEYLAEHFPSFPVMPGVLMVEAIIQTGAWLTRVTEGFKHSIFLLEEARNVRFGQFVMPGNQLKITCDQVSDDGKVAQFKANGELDGKPSVSAKVAIRRMNVVDRYPHLARDDRRLRAEHLRMFQTLAAPELRLQLQATPKVGALTSAAAG